MNICPTGLALASPHDSVANYEEESNVSCSIDENKGKAEETISGITMDFEQQNSDNHSSNGVEDEVEVEVDFEIWPVEHPMEPPDEDRPVKCPMPESSSVVNDEGKREKRLAESMRRRAEESTVKRQGKEESGAVEERPVRAVRKRHHTLTGGDDRVMPRTPPIPTTTTQNLTVFQVIQQMDRFES